jgi:hypothetical protein
MRGLQLIRSENGAGLNDLRRIITWLQNSDTSQGIKNVVQTDTMIASRTRHHACDAAAYTYLDS